jgi:hypoxanthine phosphoribosyltransferase
VPVLLIDDLWETGHTLRRVAEVLRQVGPLRDLRNLLAQGDSDSVERIVSALQLEVPSHRAAG